MLEVVVICLLCQEVFEIAKSTIRILDSGHTKGLAEQVRGGALRSWALLRRPGGWWYDAMPRKAAYGR